MIRIEGISKSPGGNCRWLVTNRSTPPSPRRTIFGKLAQTGDYRICLFGDTLSRGGPSSKQKSLSAASACRLAGEAGTPAFSVMRDFIRVLSGRKDLPNRIAIFVFLFLGVSSMALLRRALQPALTFRCLLAAC